ncbi:MAG: rod shape-determining protein MreD [Lachnospiraceae bacterium]|uniref:Rod shape-determining protein MreD n=1 Tax=Candidatus Weimeria bifida TaxID=2599074 RepID=A0A6N7IZ75_9FIRM|nr:rod shape-determining protein MreD [Candidatus Weimeria bifida]RRF96040.1 MAG: rod shape-determining protein MreD [Lachnospiraceae bacterium]
MKAVYYFFRGGIIFIALILLFILQTAIMPHLQLAATPNLMLILVSMMGFMRGRKTGAFTGLGAGLMIDLFSGQLFGTYALIYMLLGYLNGFFRKIYFGDSIRLPVILCAATDMVYGFIVYGVFFLLNGKADVLYYILNVMLPEMIYTVICALILYFPFYHLNNLLDRIHNRRERRIV